jgi:hypothetical protein
MFENYDSSSFPTLEESIAHSKENPFISTNFSAKLAIGDYLIVDPNTHTSFLSVLNSNSSKKGLYLTISYSSLYLFKYSIRVLK